MTMTADTFVERATLALRTLLPEHMDTRLSGANQERLTAAAVDTVETMFRHGGSTLKVEDIQDPGTLYGRTLRSLAADEQVIADNLGTEFDTDIPAPNISAKERIYFYIELDLSMAAERCLRDFFETEHGFDPLNDAFNLN